MIISKFVAVAYRDHKDILITGVFQQRGCCIFTSILQNHQFLNRRTRIHICYTYKGVLGVSRETPPPINIFVGFNGCPVCTTSVYRRARFRMYEFAELACCLIRREDCVLPMLASRCGNIGSQWRSAPGSPHPSRETRDFSMIPGRIRALSSPRVRVALGLNKNTKNRAALHAMTDLGSAVRCRPRRHRGNWPAFATRSRALETLKKKESFKLADAGSWTRAKVKWSL